MSEKKCRMCCSDAEWLWNGSYYCRACLRAALEVWEQNMPHICQMCGDPLDDKYYADINDYPFCSVKCALEYNKAEELAEEQEGDDE